MKLLISILALLISVPAPVAFAGYNDVTLTTDTVITVGSVSLNVISSSATLESIVVGATSFTATLAPDSSLIVQTTGRNDFETATGLGTSIVISESCTSSVSQLELSLASGNSAEVIVTPLSTVCTTSGGGGVTITSAEFPEARDN